MIRTALFTVSFAGLWGQDRLSLEQSIDTAAELGYDGVEIMGKDPERNNSASLGVEAPAPARREEGEYPAYSTDEQRRGAGCIGSQTWHLYSSTGPYWADRRGRGDTPAAAGSV